MDALSQTFSALADPTRRAMLARLSRGQASVSELAEPFRGGMSLPAVTKHLKVLERAGLITKTREAQWRPCRLHAAGLKDAAEWMEQYRAFWEESFDRLEDYLRTVTAALEAGGPKKTTKRTAGSPRAANTTNKRSTSNDARTK